ncbi:MAG: hypothetical protein AB7F88_15965 [Pyrinomonadaceae bacterium]
MRRSVITISFAGIAAFVAACQPAETPKPNVPNAGPSPAVPASPAAPAASPSVSPSIDPKAPGAKLAALEGAWPGVEGTSLKVTKNGEKYKIEITDLDKTETFEGTAKDDTIQFTRKGKLETIKAATAEETGMKWLKGQKNCVVITKGSEGYCKE